MVRQATPMRTLRPIQGIGYSLPSLLANVTVFVINSYKSQQTFVNKLSSSSQPFALGSSFAL
ncbi:MAG: hypothetical protein D6756_00790 [Cyanobacteria bacterium J083]|nr:MAG: hypothetical protein D6756_00790 [Cyanobacteria bacterium J083]